MQKFHRVLLGWSLKSCRSPTSTHTVCVWRQTLSSVTKFSACATFNSALSDPTRVLKRSTLYGACSTSLTESHLHAQQPSPFLLIPPSRKDAILLANRETRRDQLCAHHPVERCTRLHQSVDCLQELDMHPPFAIDEALVLWVQIPNTFGFIGIQFHADRCIHFGAEKRCFNIVGLKLPRFKVSGNTIRIVWICGVGELASIFGDNSLCPPLASPALCPNTSPPSTHVDPKVLVVR